MSGTIRKILKNEKDTYEVSVNYKFLSHKDIVIVNEASSN